jgi:hypothetical protein
MKDKARLKRKRIINGELNIEGGREVFYLTNLLF